MNRTVFVSCTSITPKSSQGDGLCAVDNFLLPPLPPELVTGRSKAIDCFCIIRT